MPIHKPEHCTRQWLERCQAKEGEGADCAKAEHEECVLPEADRPAGAREASAENFTARQPSAGHPIDIGGRALLSRDRVGGGGQRLRQRLELAHIPTVVVA